MFNLDSVGVRVEDDVVELGLYSDTVSESRVEDGINEVLGESDTMELPLWKDLGVSLGTTHICCGCR